MTAVIDQKEYLKKYLGLGAKDENKKKKKKKKKQAVIQSKVRVVDDELGIPAISGNGPTAFDDDLDDALTAPDELPQIAGIIDERPPEMRTAEYTNSDKWKRLGANEEENGVKEVEEVGRRVRHDSDASPERQRVRHDSDASPPRVRHDSDASPPRKKTRHDSDASPPRVRQRHDSDASPPRVRQRHDSDASPPRVRQRHDSGASPPRQRVRHDSDASPPRVRQRLDSDASPPRQRIRHDSDASPPRRGKITMDFPPVKIKKEIVSPEARAKQSKKPSLDEKGRRLTTMDGKRAGLQSKETLRMENEAAQARERNAILNAGDDISGRGASTVVRRDRKEEERRRKREEKAARKAAVAAKYQVWNSGVETAKEKEQKVAQEIYVASKPLARYADDVDLERDLRERERADDPMLEYVKKKKAEKFKEENPNYVERPKYQPPPQPPINRFNIWPGYRWDGVDRSSGFENDFYAKQASRKASEEEAYKWSIEDM